MGEGGAVFTNNDDPQASGRIIPGLGTRLLLRSGKENTCGKRFGWQLGDLPKGYDHKYTYSHIGFNLKISDMQAACALAQMDRLKASSPRASITLPGSRTAYARRRNFLILPEATPARIRPGSDFPDAARYGANASGQFP